MENITLQERNELIYLREKVKELETDNSMLEEKVKEMTRQISFLTSDNVTFDNLSMEDIDKAPKEIFHTLNRDFDSEKFIAIEREDGSVIIPGTGEVFNSVSMLKHNGYDILS